MVYLQECQADSKCQNRRTGEQVQTRYTTHQRTLKKVRHKLEDKTLLHL